MRNKFTSNLLKKGLISFAAASVLATSGFAITTITNYGATPDREIYTGVTFETDEVSKAVFYGNVVIGDKLGTYTTNKSAGDMDPITLNLTISSNTGIVGYEYNTSNEINTGSVKLITASDLDSDASILVDKNASDSYVYLIDLNSSGGSHSSAVYYIGTANLDVNTTGSDEYLALGIDDEGNTSASALALADVYGTGADGGYLIDTDVTAASYVKVGDVDSYNSGMKLSFLAIVDDNVTTTGNEDRNVSFKNLMLAPISTSSTGDVKIGAFFGSDSEVQNTVATYKDVPVEISANSSETEVPNVTTDSSSSVSYMVDVEVYDNYRIGVGPTTDTDDNITLALTSGVTLATAATLTSGWSDAHTSDSNLTIDVQSQSDFDTNSTADGGAVITFNSIDTSAITSGNAIELSFSSTNSGDFSTLATSSQSVTIANVTDDGIEVELADESDEADDYLVAVGKTRQVVSDINISEKFYNTFSAGDAIVLTVPSGFTFATTTSSGADYHPVVVQYEGTTAQRNDTATTASQNQETNGTYSSDATQYTVYMGDADTAATFMIYDNTGSVETLNVSGLLLNVPEDASIGDLNLEITSPISGDSISPISIATTVDGYGSITAENNLTVGGIGYVAKNGSVDANLTYVDINVSKGSLITAAQTVTFTLSDGEFSSASGGDIGCDSSSDNIDSVSPTDLTMISNTPTLSDDSKTLTFKVASASDDGYSRYCFPEIDLNGVEVGTTASITAGGTALVTGSVNVAMNYDAALEIARDGAITAHSNDAIAFYPTGSIRVTETNELTALDSAETFTLRAPVNESGLAYFRFTGNYKVATKLGTTANKGSYSTTTGTTDTNNDTDDAIQITIPTGFTDGKADSIYVIPEIKLLSRATEGEIYPISVLKSTDDTAAIATTDIDLVYVGDSAPTQTVEVDGTSNTAKFANPSAMGTATEVAATALSEDGTLTDNGDGSVSFTPTGAEEAINIIFGEDGTISLPTGYTIKSIALSSRAIGDEYTITVEDKFGQEVDIVIVEGEGTETSGEDENTTEPTTMTTPALVAGWNLLGNASGSNIDSSTLGGEIVWTFDANPEVLWTQDATIANGAGFWYKATAAGEGLEFTMGNETAKVADNFVAGTWSLLGCGGEKTIADVKAKSELTDSTIVWAYDGSAEQPWSNDDATTVKAGQGYWVK